jgi:hypothetical protein
MRYLEGEKNETVSRNSTDHYLSLYNSNILRAMYYSSFWFHKDNRPVLTDHHEVFVKVADSEIITVNENLRSDQNQLRTYLLSLCAFSVIEKALTSS